MGTNYYWRPACDVCGCTHERPPREHIGKSSAGWTFGFHATDNIRSVSDWRDVLNGAGTIVDEYGEHYEPEEFWAMVEARRSSPNNHSVLYPRDGTFLDADGNSFSEGEFS